MKTQSFQGGKHGTNSAIQGGVVEQTIKKFFFRFEQEIRRRCTRKEMKQSFETKITIRIYDTAFANELDEAYVASGERFESKNHFLTSLIRIGLERYILEQKVKAEGSIRPTQIKRSRKSRNFWMSLSIQPQASGNHDRSSRGLRKTRCVHFGNRLSSFAERRCWQRWSTWRRFWKFVRSFGTDHFASEV